MAKFTIQRSVDALVLQSVEINAPDAKSASDIARSNEQSLHWQSSEVVTFDARKFVVIEEDGSEMPGSAVGDF